MKVLIALAIMSVFPPEQRAMWVVANTFRDSAEVRKMVEFAHKNGIKIIFAQIARSGYAYYDSDILPRSEALKVPEPYDPLAHLLSLTKPLGIQVHAWINAVAWWSVESPPESSNHIYYTHPEWFVVDDDGRSMHSYSRQDIRNAGTEARFLDPMIPEVRKFIASIYIEVARKYDVDGVHFDFIRYPGPKFGYADWERQFYESQHGLDPMFISDAAKIYTPKWNIMRSKDLYERWMTYHYLRWNWYRRQAVTEIVKMVHDSIKSFKPNVIISAAVFPNPASTAFARGQDWRTWVEQGYVDWVCPMAYTPYPKLFERYTQYAMGVKTGKVKVFMGIGIWFKNAEYYGRQELEIAEKYGADGVVLFSYNVFHDNPELAAKLFARRKKRVYIGRFGIHAY